MDRDDSLATLLVEVFEKRFVEPDQWDSGRSLQIRDRLPRVLANRMSDVADLTRESLITDSDVDWPGVAVYDERVTDRDDFFPAVVLCFDARGERILLALNQLYDADERDETLVNSGSLERRSEAIRRLTGTTTFQTGPLEEWTSATRGDWANHFAESTIYYRSYGKDDFDEESLALDVAEVAHLYEDVVSRDLYDRVVRAEAGNLPERGTDLRRALEVEDFVGGLSEPYEGDDRPEELDSLSAIANVIVSEEAIIDLEDELLGVTSGIVEGFPMEEVRQAFRLAAAKPDEVEEDDWVDEISEPTTLRDYPLGEHVLQFGTDGSVWRLRAYADDYATLVKHGAVALDRATEATVEGVTPGDVMLFYAMAEARNPELSVDGGGIVGGGIVADTTTKAEAWTWAERAGYTHQPLVVEFDDLYVTGDLDKLESATPVDGTWTDDRYQVAVDALTATPLPAGRLAGLLESVRLTPADRGGVLVDLVDDSESVEGVQAILREISPALDAVDGHGSESEPLESVETRPPQADALLEQLRRSKQAVLYGPPGTGKTWTATRTARWWLHDQLPEPTADHLEVVTFHPSFSYEDFVEGLSASNGPDGQVSYEITDGTFKSLCRRADRAFENADDTESAPPYVLVVDELNRGDLPRIFGELLTGLETDKRRGAENEISTRLAHSGEEFLVPPNLYVIATMNTADRSIALVDAAIRRRFAFVPFTPDYDLVRTHYDIPQEANLDDLDATVLDGPDARLLELSIRAVAVINRAILDAGDLGKGKQIGHTYLLGHDSTDDLVDAWRYEILPLLEEYFFGDIRRLAEEVLGDPDSPLVDLERRTIEAVDEAELTEALEALVGRA